MLEIGVFEDDERVAAAELHRRRFQVLAGPRRDASAGRDAAGQRDTFDTNIIDDTIRLIVRDQQIGIQPGGRARVDPQLLEGDGALRHDAGVLHQHDVARHQMRTGDPGKLVVGKIPRLHAEDHTNRAALHMAFAEGRMKLHRRQEAFGVLGVIGENIRAELDLPESLADALAHLECHRMRELVGLGMQQLRRLGDDDRALGVGLVPPGFETLFRRRDLRLKFLIGQALKLLQNFAGRGIGALVFGRFSCLDIHLLVLFDMALWKLMRRRNSSREHGR